MLFFAFPHSLSTKMSTPKSKSVAKSANASAEKASHRPVSVDNLPEHFFTSKPKNGDTPTKKKMPKIHTGVCPIVQLMSNNHTLDPYDCSDIWDTMCEKDEKAKEKSGKEVKTNRSMHMCKGCSERDHKNGN